MQTDVERVYLEEAIGNEQGSAEAIVFPGTAEEVAAVVAHCYANDVPIVPRGGGTGLAGGAVPHGGVLVSLERLTKHPRVRSAALADPGRGRRADARDPPCRA